MAASSMYLDMPVTKAVLSSKFVSMLTLYTIEPFRAFFVCFLFEKINFKSSFIINLGGLAPKTIVRVRVNNSVYFL